MCNGESDRRQSELSAELTDERARKLLGGLKPPRHSTNAPARDALLCAVEQAGALRRPVLRLAFSGLALAAIAVLAWWAAGRLAHPGEPAAGLLAPDAAWAAVDATVLTYELVSRTPGIADREAQSINKLEQAVLEIADKYEQLNPPDNPRGVVHTGMSTGTSYGPWTHFDKVEVFVLADDSNLLAELKSALQGIPGIWGPEEYSRTLYYSSRFPDLYLVPGRMLWVDGAEYRVPQDLDEGRMRQVQAMLRNEAGTITYWANREISFVNPLPEDSPVARKNVYSVEVTSAGDIVCTTYPEWAKFDLPEECYTVSRISANMEGDDPADSVQIDLRERRCPIPVSVTFKTADLGPDFDPIAALQAEYDKLAERRRANAARDNEVYWFYYPLFAEQRMQTNLNSEFSQAEQAWSLEVAAAAQTAAAAFAAEHEEVSVATTGEKLCGVNTLTLGDQVVLLLTPNIMTSEPQQAVEFNRLIKQVTGLDEADWDTADYTMER